MDTWVCLALIVLVASFAATCSGRAQGTLAQLSRVPGASGPLLLAALGTAALTSLAMALAGAWLGGMATGAARAALAGAGFLAAVLELARPAEVRTLHEPTRSLGAIALVLAARQALDAARWIAFAGGAALADPAPAALGAALGSGAALALALRTGSARGICYKPGMEKIEIIEGADAAAIADWLEARLSKALSDRASQVAIALPGGSTPFPIMEALATRDLAWSRLAIWPGDDRIVPEDHPASNTGKIRALFEPLGATVATLTADARPPHFAIAWLGMGGDGHIASLFPNTDPQVDDPRAVRRLTPDPLPPEAPFDRLTLTIPALLDSDELLFVIRGGDKQALFEAALRGAHDLPVARLLGAARQPVTCFT